MNNSQITEIDKAFYYPHIEIQDINWLKQALLYWDGLRRMVPPGFSPNDSNIRQVIDTGFLEDTSPEIYCQAASERFLRQIEPLTKKSILSKIKRLLGYKSISEQEFLVPDIDFFSQDAQEFLGNDFWNMENFQNLVPVDRMYDGQTTDEVFEILESLKLANRSDEGGYEVHALLGGFYRMCLATEMSETIGIPLVTDAHHYKICGEYFSFGSPIKKNPSENTFGVLMELDIEFPTSEFLEEIPLSKIIKFHNKHKDERKRFRKAIESTISTTESISDLNALQDSLNSKTKEIKSAFEEHRKSLQDLKISSFNFLP